MADGPIAAGDSLELTPTRLGRRGEAEAEFDNGWRVRIPGAIPGEAARATVLHVSKGGPVAVARFDGPAGAPHPARRTPPCEIHDTCGGCGLQQIEPGPALALKIAQAEALLGVGLASAIESPDEFHYRAKTFMLPQARGARLVLGARPPRGEELVDTTGCRVLRPELEALAARTRAVLFRRTDEDGHLRTAMLRCNRVGHTQVTLVHAGRPDWLEEAAVAVGADAAYLQRHDARGNVICSDADEQLVAGEPIVETFLGIEAVVPPTAFMQGNPDVAEALYGLAADALAGRHVTELYCGAGVAGLLALRRDNAGRLTGIDRSPRAVAGAKENARRNGLADRCHFRAEPAEAANIRGEAVLVNPPRAGCDEAVLDAVAGSEADTLVYMSCHPATLARDIERLGWRVVAVTPADMFPQTPHLELLAVMRR